MTNWLPMSTAPTDGTIVLLAVLHYHEPQTMLGRFDSQEHHRKPAPYWKTESAYGVTRDREAKFLGWMPLPEPPMEEVTP